MSAVVVRETIRFRFINLNFRDHGSSWIPFHFCQKHMPPLNDKHTILSAMDNFPIWRWSMIIVPRWCEFGWGFTSHVWCNRRVTHVQPPARFPRCLRTRVSSVRWVSSRWLAPHSCSWEKMSLREKKHVAVRNVSEVNGGEASYNMYSPCRW